jgi:hypothetical protein
MGTQVAPLGLRLFLEGVEVPVISAQVSIQPSQPAGAAIQIIPLDSALLLLPRTLVHLFYLDNEFVEASSTSRNDTFGRVKDDLNRFQVADEQYKLLFAGEVIGLNYTKTPTGRSMVLQCMDLSSYWDTCYQWFADFSVGGNGLYDHSHHFVAAGQYLFNNVASGTMWTIANILRTGPANPDYSKATGLLGGLIHLLESIGGLRPKKGGNYKAFRGVNDFFTIAELKYNLTGMIGAIEADKTSARMFGSAAFRSWLKNGMTSAGSLVSYRDVIRLVGQYIFHDVYPNPAPLYVKGGTRISQRVPQVVADTVVGSQILSALDQHKQSIESVIVSIDLSQAQVAGQQITTGLSEQDGVAPLQKIRLGLSAIAESVSNSGSSDASRVNQFILLANSILSATIAEIRSSLQISNGNSFISASQADVLIGQLQSAVQNIDRILNSNSARRTTEKDVEVTQGDHLYSQLILPETFMMVPPRCNVLFPDMYFNLSYSRNFMREVSRLACQGGLGMIASGLNKHDSRILGHSYIAPNIRDVRGKVAFKTIFLSGSTILPHEVHSGIIPKFEHVTDGHRWGTKAAKSQGKSVLNKKISYVQRLANFQFFIHRWSARTMGVQARFNPHMVIGLPGVVIDRATPSIAALIASGDRLDSGRALLPTAYVGKIVNLSHNVDQGGGTTTVQYSLCRTHRGIDDEFLGVLARENKEVSNEPVILDITTMLQNVQNQVPNDDDELQFLRLFVDGRLAPGASLLRGTLSGIAGNDGPFLEVTVDDLRSLGIPFDAILTYKARQASKRDQLDDPVNGMFFPELITLVVEFIDDPGKYVRTAGQAPFEDLAMPGYYSRDVWEGTNITTKVYLPLLGTRAITDDNAVGDPTKFAGLIKASIENAGIINSAVDIEADGEDLVLTVDGKPAANLGLNLETGTTTETAIDGITALYSILKKKDLNTQSFIDDYVKRPVASLIEVLGDSDLRFDDLGEIVLRLDGTEPFEGFHSRAFGPYNVDVRHRVDTSEPPKKDFVGPPEPVAKSEAGQRAFLGLVPPDEGGVDAALKKFSKASTIVKSGKKKKNTPIEAALDPRGRAQSRVRSYADELSVTRGILAT